MAIYHLFPEFKQDLDKMSARHELFLCQRPMEKNAFPERIAFYLQLFKGEKQIDNPSIQ